MVLTLIQNVALVVMLATVQRYLARILDEHPALAQIASGILYGAVALVGMLTPLRFAETPGKAQCRFQKTIAPINWT